MYNYLKALNVTDKAIREKHIELINNVKDKTTEVTTDTAKCTICGKAVSEKVKTFCLSNKEKFKGNIYCFEHQE